MSKVSLFEDDVVIASATNVNQDSDTDWRYSGRLGTTDLFIQNLSTDNISWIAVATRDFDVIVALSYAGPGGVTYTVKAGCPLLVTNEAGGSAFVGATVSSANNTEAADVEIHVYEGDQPFAPPDPAFLILNASTGITTDIGVPGSVTKWTDLRPTTSAPADFSFSVSSALSPLLISSDSDFNGQPSVDFGGSQVGNGQYTYDIPASAIFNFMRDTAFTVAAVLKIPDGPLSDTGVTVGEYGQGIWNNNNATSGKNGYRAFLEGGNRLQVQSVVGASAVEDKTANDEIVSKSMVVIWKCDGTNIQVYWQGRWQPSHAVSQTTANDTTPFEVGNALFGSTAQHFKGKIADIRAYDFEWDANEYNAYIADAVSTYGVDDTEGITNPFVTSAKTFHRANRGITAGFAAPNEAKVAAWFDTRREANSASYGWLSTTGPFAPTTLDPDPILNHKTLAFDTAASQTLLNPFGGTEGDFLGGSAPGFTLCFVYYDSGTLNDQRALFAMGSYLDASLDGTSIFYRGGSGSDNLLTYEIDNGAAADVVFAPGTGELLNTPRAVIFRVDGTSFWIDEKNLTTGVITSSSGTFADTPSVTTSVNAWLFSFANTGSGFLDGGLSETVTVATKKTNAEILEYFTYVSSRYGA